MKPRVTFSQQFEDTCLGEFRIEPRLVNSAITVPDSSQILPFVGLFTKWTNEEKNQYLLIIATQIADGWRVDFGFPIYSEMGDIETIKPLEILERFVERFGVEIQVAGEARKLFFDFVPPIKLGTSNPTELLTFPRESVAGLFASYARFEQSGTESQIRFGLLFAIDTYAYIQWLFGWNNISADFSAFLPDSFEDKPDGQGFCLTNSEIEKVHAKAQDMQQNMASSQYQIAEMLGAFTLLKKTFGQEWYEEILNPNHSKPNFLMREMGLKDERAKSSLLILQLAEAIFRLRKIPGFQEKVSGIQNNPIEIDGLEALWFEFFIPFLIQENGHKILNFIPEKRDKRTPDILVDFRSQLLPLEIKTKLEGANFSTRALSGPLGSACGQLPETGPGAICLLIPSRWRMNDTFLQKAEATINGTLLRNRNCNAVFVHWSEYQTLANKTQGLFWRFTCFTNAHPKYPVPKITELVNKIREPVEPKVTEVTFLSGVSE